jgi:hypothetical protein
MKEIEIEKIIIMYENLKLDVSYTVVHDTITIVSVVLDGWVIPASFIDWIALDYMGDQIIAHLNGERAEPIH